VILPDGYDEHVPDARKQLVDCGVYSREQALELAELVPARDAVAAVD
jgi:hypothetical protein